MGKIMINPILPVWLVAIICVGLLFCKRRTVGAYIRQVLAILLLFVINLRPMTPNETINIETEKLNLKVVFVIDNTISMLAQDYKGDQTRLDGVAADVAHIVDFFNGADFSVVSFNNNASIMVPFTDNASYVATMVKTMYPIRDIYAKGSSMNTAHDTMKFVVEQAYQKEDGDVILFFLSDGEITDDSQLQSFSDISSYIADGAVLGYGSYDGGIMYYDDPFFDEPEVIIDYSQYPSEPAVSKIDEAVLNRMAKDLGLEYVHMTSTEKIDNILDNIKYKTETNAAKDKELVEKEISGAKDTYYYFAGALIILIIWEGINVSLNVAKHGRKKENDEQEQ